jgi:hypothetical protein
VIIGLVAMVIPGRAAAQPSAFVDVDTEQELRDAIFAIAGDTARGEDHGPYTIDISGDITLTQSLPIIRAILTPTNPHLTIDGHGHTIDANNTGRVFFIASGRVSIRNVTIANARAHGGAGGASVDAGGGGGGLGAGAAVFVNAWADVTVANVTVQQAAAIGGNGGSGLAPTGTLSGGAGGGGLGGRGGDAPLMAGGGGGGYAASAAGGSATGSGGGGGGEFGAGGNASGFASGGGGGGGREGHGGDTTAGGGGGGGGATADVVANTGNGPQAGGGAEGGSGGTSGGGGVAGAALGGGGGGGYDASGGNGGLSGGAGGSGDINSGFPIGGNGESGGGGGGGRAAGGTGGEFGGGGGTGFNGSLHAGNGGFGGGGGGAGGSTGGFGNTAHPGVGGFGAGAGGSGSGQTTAGGQYGGSGAHGGGGGAALGGAIFVRDSGVLTLSDVAFTGAFITTPGAAGVASATAGEAHGATAFLMTGSTATIEVTGSNVREIAGDDALAGAGRLTKSGSGTLVISGMNTYTGETGVTGGTLMVNGSVTSAITVGAGASLAGTGQTNGVTLSTAASLAPGGAAGTGILRAATVTFAPGSVLKIRIDGPNAGTEYDRLAVSGTATLLAPTLELSAGYVPTPGTTFTILTNAVGGFAGLAEGARIVLGPAVFRLSYAGGDGDDVVLTAEGYPTIAPLIDRTIDEDAVLGPLDMVVGDTETAAAGLVVSAASSNQALLPDARLTLGGSGATRTLSATPLANASGTTTITVRVMDGAGLIAQRTFLLTVTAINDPPTITPLLDQVTSQGVATSAIPFFVADVETPDVDLTVTANSSNLALVPAANVTLGGTGAARSVTVRPAAGAHGTATITVTVSDGHASSSRAFTLTVTAAPDDPTPDDPDDPPPPPPPPPPSTARSYYLAEGATGDFFETDLLIANPQAIEAPITIEFLRPDGVTIGLTRTLAPLSRITIRLNDTPGLEATTASTRVVSTNGVAIVVERTMWWDARRYGAHTEKATEGAAPAWYFAEGAQGFFSTFLLLMNPQPAANVAHVTWLREGEPVLARDYSLPPSSRVTIDASADPELVNRSFGARVLFDQPGAAERAMYFGRDPLWTGGTASAGATEPSGHWLLAEGATGSYFTTFVLIANPGAEPATLTMMYLPADGPPVQRTHVLAGGQRLTINIATEDASLESAAVSTDVVSTVPVIVERAQYWPQSTWQEGHASVGVTSPATTWGLAEGRVGGPGAAQTYILLANPGTVDALVTVTFLRVNGAPLVKTFTVRARSRFNVAIGGPGSDVPELANEDFGARVDSSQPLVVERSLYSNADSVIWAAGTNATATRLP